MANEVKATFTSGRTLTYGAYTPAGSVRTAAGTSLPEIGSTGFYTATDAAIVAGDTVRVSDSVYGYIGGAEYKPEISASVIEGKIDALTTAVSAIQVSSGTVSNTFNEIQPPPAQVFNG